MDPLNSTKERLLRVAGELLSLADQSPSNAAENNPTVTTVAPTPGSSSSSLSTVAGNQAPSVAAAATPNMAVQVQEHRRLFNYKGRSSYVGKGKGPAKKKNPTCTMKFFCLGNPLDDRPPSSLGARTALCNAGLGPANLSLVMDGSSIHQELLNTFPALSSGGGYELLLYQRGGCDQGFHKIPAPYMPSKIKALANQATVYIRPLQVDITGETSKTVCHEPSAPKVQCFHCMKEVEMDKLREHQDQEHPVTTKRKRQATLFDVDLVSGDDDDNQASMLPEPKTLRIPSCTTTDCTSTNRSQELQHLSEMFPDKTSSELEASLIQNGSYSKTVNSLLGQKSMALFDDNPNDYDTNAAATVDADDDDDELLYSICLGQSKEERLSSEIKSIQRKMSVDKVKLKIDEEDLLEDAMVYYKAEEFDPTKRLRIVYSGQSAADTGGVVGQFYTQLLCAVSKQFFQGLDYRTPIYSSDVVAAGVMKLVGVMVAHSILQGGPGFPIFSPAVYNYLCKGDLQEAVKTMTTEDCSLHMQDLITKIAGARDVQELDDSVKEEVGIAMAESGLTTVLSTDNKMNVIQNLIIHDAIGKRKVVLDQLREGLQALGFGARLSVYPDLFEGLFVAGNNITCSKVKECLVFPVELTDEEGRVKEYCEDYLQTASIEKMKDLLIFATGAPCVPDFGLGKIHIEFTDDSSISSSTCLKKITFPRKFPGIETFMASINAVCDNAGRAFTSI